VDALAQLAAVLVFSLLGTGIGAAAGLVPGLHINNLAYMLGASAGGMAGLASGWFAGFGAGPEDALLMVGAMLVSCLVAHLLTGILPSVFLGAPDPGLALSVLPAHRLLMKGRGVEAVRCSVTGAVGALAACLLALPAFRLVMGDPVGAYERLRPSMPAVLVLVVALLVASEPPGRGGRRRRCVLVLCRIRSAVAALSEDPAGERHAPAGGGPVAARPWQLPDLAGRAVVVTGVVSRTSERAGRLSFSIEEGAPVDVLVPDALVPDLPPVRVGDIVVAEGHVAPAVETGSGLARKAMAAALFLGSGFLGLVVLESGRVAARNWYPLGAPPLPDAVMMFPLFCGLFGLPTLLLSAFERQVTPAQEDRLRPLSRRNRLRGILAGSLVGGLLGWYPGMTAGHGAVLGKLLSGEGEDERPDGDDAPGDTVADGRSAGECGGGNGGDPAGRPSHWSDDQSREFLVCASAVMVANAFFNIVALFVIQRARSGALHVTAQILGPGLSCWEPAGSLPSAFALLALSAALSALLAVPLVLHLGKRFARAYDRVPYRPLTLSVMAMLLFLMFLFSGAAGLAVCGAAVCLGLVAPLAGLRRVHLMGAILLPVILYFLGASAGVMAFLGL